MKSEETTYQNEETQLVENEVIRTPEVIQEVAKKKDDQKWKKVVIGGVAGIALGGASVYAANTIDGAETEEEELEDANDGGEVAVSEDSNVTVDESIQVAEVSDDMSFGEAFAEAREQVGTGGIFEWHGDVYSTHYAEEWESMSAEERAEYSSHINYGGGSNDNDVAEADNNADDVVAAEVDNEEADVAENSEVDPEIESDDEVVAEVEVAPEQEQDVEVLAVADETEVQIVGVDSEALSEESVMAEVQVEGDDIFYIDTDGDGEVDAGYQLETGLETSEVDVVTDDLDPNMGMDQDQFLASNDLPDYIGEDCSLA